MIWCTECSEEFDQEDIFDAEFGDAGICCWCNQKLLIAQESQAKAEMAAFRKDIAENINEGY